MNNKKFLWIILGVFVIVAIAPTGCNLSALAQEAEPQPQASTCAGTESQSGQPWPEARCCLSNIDRINGEITGKAWGVNAVGWKLEGPVNFSGQGYFAEFTFPFMFGSYSVSFQNSIGEWGSVTCDFEFFPKKVYIPDVEFNLPSKKQDCPIVIPDIITLPRQKIGIFISGDNMEERGAVEVTHPKATIANVEEYINIGNEVQILISWAYQTGTPPHEEWTKPAPLSENIVTNKIRIIGMEGECPAWIKEYHLNPFQSH